MSGGKASTLPDLATLKAQIGYVTGAPESRKMIVTLYWKCEKCKFTICCTWPFLAEIAAWLHQVENLNINYLIGNYENAMDDVPATDDELNLLIKHPDDILKYTYFYIAMK